MSVKKFILTIQSGSRLARLVENSKAVLEAKISQMSSNSEEYLAILNKIMLADATVARLKKAVHLAKQVLYSFGVDTYKAISESKMYELSMRIRSLKKDDYRMMMTFVDILQSQIKEVQNNVILVNGK